MRSQRKKRWRRRRRGPSPTLRTRPRVGWRRRLAASPRGVLCVVSRADFNRYLRGELVRSIAGRPVRRPSNARGWQHAFARVLPDDVALVRFEYTRRSAGERGPYDWRFTLTVAEPWPTTVMFTPGVPIVPPAGERLHSLTVIDRHGEPRTAASLIKTAVEVLRELAKEPPSFAAVDYFYPTREVY